MHRPARAILSTAAIVIAMSGSGCVVLSVASTAASVAGTAVSVGVTAGSVAIGAVGSVASGAVGVGSAMIGGEN